MDYGMELGSLEMLCLYLNLFSSIIIDTLQFDDPNTTIANILNVLRNSEITVNFAPNKLKTGAGECCLYVLDRLSDLALVANDFKWNR